MITADMIKHYPIFSNLSGQSLEEVARLVTEVNFPAGTIIIKQNTPPDYYYFVVKGEVEVTKRNKFGQEAKICILGKGEGFGEMALLTSTHRQNTVTAQTEVTLWSLSKKDFEKTVIMESSFKWMMENKIKDYKQYNHLKTLQPLALIDSEKMPALRSKMTEKEYKAGDTIITQDEKPDAYYIIRSGSVSVFKKKDPDEDFKLVDTLMEGQGFGEESIIREENRNATVKANVDCTLLVIDKDDFNKVLKSSFIDFTFPEDVFEEEWQKYVFIDARIPPEYEELHIEGAINIPLEQLRHRFNELDKEQEYLTYCTNDSRGMAAAFLLSSMGFKARNLRSGLGGWEGPTSTVGDGIQYPSL